MKKSILILALLVAAVSTFGSIRAITPVPQSESASSWWYQRFLYDKEYVKENEVPFMFVGDSITELWMVDGRGLSVLNKYFKKAPYNALVAGYSADRTEHVIWRMENGELDGHKPKAISLMIGTNNTWHYDESQEAPCDTVLGIRSCIDTIKRKSPKTKIFLFAILPCGRSGSDPRRARNAVVNDAMRELCDGESVVFCEINNQVMDCNVFLIIDDGVEFLSRDTKQCSHLRRQRTEIPDMCYGNDEFDMTHTLSTHFLLCYFDTATLADDTFITDTFVLTTMALIVLSRTKDALAEETVTLRFVGTIVNRFRFEHFTAGQSHNLVRGSKTNSDLGETVLSCWVGIFFLIVSHSCLLHLYRQC